MLKVSLFCPWVACLIMGSLCGCWKKKTESGDNLLNGGKLVVSQNNMAFSIDEVTKEPGEEISFDFVNKLDEKIRFYLLKDNEDPIVVQHLKAQQGGVPKDYFLFESSDVDPGTELKVTFKAPTKEGVYSFVGVGEVPRESLVGRLVVVKKELPKKGEKGLADDAI